MPPTCTVCRHPERSAIDEQLLKRLPLRDIARRYGLKKDAVHRHGSCIVEALQKSDLAQSVTAKGVVLKFLAEIQELADSCRKTHPRDWLLVCDRATRAAEVLGRISGEIAPANSVTIVQQLGAPLEEAKAAVKVYREAQVEPAELEQRALEFLKLRGYTCVKEESHAQVAS